MLGSNIDRATQRLRESCGKFALFLWVLIFPSFFSIHHLSIHSSNHPHIHKNIIIGTSKNIDYFYCEYHIWNVVSALKTSVNSSSLTPNAPAKYLKEEIINFKQHTSFWLIFKEILTYLTYLFTDVPCFIYSLYNLKVPYNSTLLLIIAKTRNNPNAHELMN